MGFFSKAKCVINGIKVKVKVSQSCPTLCDPMNYSWNSLGQNTGVGSLSLLQGIFPTQGLNPGLSHCKWILYELSHKGSPRILEWVAKFEHTPGVGDRTGKPGVLWSTGSKKSDTTERLN